MADNETTASPKNVDSLPLEAPDGNYDKRQGDDGAVDSSGITVGRVGAGFCACFDHLVPNCLMTWCCPWISLAQITSRMGLAPYSKALMFFLGIWIAIFVLNALASVTTTFNLVSLPLVVVYIYAVWQLRGKVRERFHIPGSPLEDLLLSWCCGCCAVAQMASHIKSYKPGSCDFGPVDTLAPYNPVN